jgi:hypothetical protein
VAAITKQAARDEFDRKAKLSQVELQALPVREVLLCQGLWHKWVCANPDPAVAAARRLELVASVATTLGTSVPGPSAAGDGPGGLPRFLVELAQELANPDQSHLASRLTEMVGLRVRYAALERRTDVATAKRWFATVGPHKSLAPPEDAAFVDKFAKSKPATPSQRPRPGPPPRGQGGHRHRSRPGRQPVRRTGPPDSGRRSPHPRPRPGRGHKDDNRDALIAQLLKQLKP